MTINIMKGDLLKESVDAIVNTVNCVGVMGKGIALQFKKKWPENYKVYSHACKEEKVKTGKMFIYDAGGLVQPHYIINFPTKQHWREKTKMSYIDEGLKDLIKQVQSLKIKSIAIPPLGCGNGGLDWADVKPRIEKAFSDLPDVDVRLFEPSGGPDPASMETNTKKPKMTPGRAAIVKVLSIYRQMEFSLSKLEVQKLAYFLEFAGRDLKLNFTKDKFGPYSDVLRHVLTTMDGHYIEGVGDNVVESEIQPTKSALSEAENFIRESGDEDLQNHVERVAALIEGFETPYGMELLSSVHWVFMNESGVNDVDDAIRAIQSWNNRKKEIFQEPHIRLAWNRLKEQGWLA
ncbi:MAG TPA: macro domain-containing protein [Gammaproteobacteria bacterium]